MQDDTGAGDDPAPPANILLVDDQPANLAALAALLADLGQNLVAARSGDEALRLLLQQDFAVILLDVQMHGLDGFATAQFIRGRERSRHTPIIFLTAHDSADFPVARAYELGAVDYLVKPVLPIILRAKTAAFVDLFQKTERLRRLERRESERRYRALADSMPQIVWAARPDGCLDYYNRRWYEFSGFPEGGTGDDSWLPILHADDAPKCLGAWYAAVASGEPYQIEYRFKDRASGGYRWHLGRALPVRDDAGRVVRWYGTCTDIDDQKRLEQGLRDANAAKDQFLVMLAHELRNPLAPLLNSLFVLGRDEAVRRAHGPSLERMERQLGRLNRKVEDLLEASRVVHGRIRLRPARLDLARLVRTAAEDRRPLLEQVGVALTVEVADAPVVVRGDADRLAQVLDNLFDNAAKFVDHGGRVVVRLTTDCEASRAVLTLLDTGIGVAPEMLGRLFDVFAQADQSLERSRGGLGLGLAVVKGLVEQHGGTVAVVSAGPGRGTEFTVRLPLEPEPPALSPASEAARRSDGAGSRVLVIEDNHDAAESLRMLLELMGHEARVAFTGREGVDQALGWAPDVVLCDIGLPELDGYQVARRLRREARFEKVLFVALTGYNGEDDRRRSREAGFDHHLAKPADVREIQGLLAARGA